MVQTITVTEGTLDCMANFLLENPDAIPIETNWWHPRIKVVEKWLREQAPCASLPEDGTEEMIRKHIERGDTYTKTQLKCWKHILLELSDLPCFSTPITDMDGSIGQASPSRGKLRAGKELIILSDENQDNSTREPPLSSDSSGDQSALVLNRTLLKTAPSGGDSGIDGTTNSRKLSSMSMMERQAEWLRKKQEKAEAEKQRQEQEKQKELTFQPKLTRRSTYSSDRPLVKDNSLSQSSSTPSAPIVSKVTRGDVLNGLKKSDSTEIASSMESAANIRPPTASVIRPKSRTGKKKKFIPTTQTISVSSDLLASMKSTLEASLTRSTTASPNCLVDEEDQDTGGANDEDGTTDSDPVIIQEPIISIPPAELKAWSDKPMICGFPVDFDSSDTKARLVLQDASRFELSSMYRKTDRKAGRDGIALHMGRREDTFEEEVIAILFDKEKVSESDASKWWKDHDHRFLHYVRDRSPTANPSLASAIAALTTGTL